MFQHKIGGRFDDAYLYYQQAWAQEMEALFGGPRPDYDSLSSETRERMMSVYKLDPSLMNLIA